MRRRFAARCCRGPYRCAPGSRGGLRTLAGGVEDVKSDPQLAKIAREFVKSIRTELTVDWADREATDANIRAKIKCLFRKRKYRPLPPAVAGGGRHGVDDAAHLVLE